MQISQDEEEVSYMHRLQNPNPPISFIYAKLR